MLHVHVVVVSPVPVSCGDWTVWRLFFCFMFPVGREVAWHAVKGKANDNLWIRHVKVLNKWLLVSVVACKITQNIAVAR